MATTELATRMLAAADENNLPKDHELRTKAQAFDEAALGYYGDPQTCDARKFMGCWARARRAWCEYSGESLI